MDSTGNLNTFLVTSSQRHDSYEDIVPDSLAENQDLSQNFSRARKSASVIKLHSPPEISGEMENDWVGIMGRTSSANIALDIEVDSSNVSNDREKVPRNQLTSKSKALNNPDVFIASESKKVSQVTGSASTVSASPPDNPGGPEVEVHVNDDEDDDDILNVDEMKVKSVYTMIEDCKVRSGTRILPKKLLYLTNRQAGVFDESIMGKFLEALDIGDPKLVIILLGGSFGFRSQMLSSHKEVLGTKEELFNPLYLSSNIDVSDEESYRTQALNFMQTSVLPIAIQTEALILISGSNDCFLSDVFSQVALSEQAKYSGDSCPFKVIALAFGVQVHLAATNKLTSNSISGQLFNQSKAWKKRVDFASEFWNKFPGMNLPKSDLTGTASRYVIFEGIYEEIHKVSKSDVKISKTIRRCRRDITGRTTFEETLLGYLVKKLPMIALFSNQLGAPITYMHGLIEKRVPVVLLDGRERCFTSNTVEPVFRDTQTKLARESNAFPEISYDQQQKIEKIMNKTRSVDRLEGGLELMSIGEEILIRHWQCFIEHSLTDCWNISTLSFLRSLVWSASGNGLINQKRQKHMAHKTLYDRIQDLEELERSNLNSLVSSTVPLELVSRAINFYLTTCHVYSLLAQHQHIETWLSMNEDHVFYNDAMLLESKLKSQIKQYGVLDADINSHRLTTCAVTQLDHSDIPNRLAYKAILTQPNVYSVSMYNPAEMNLIVNSITKVDRLPDYDTLESLRIIQESWDCIEMYHAAADAYKYVAKTAFISLLLLGVLITLLAILNQAYDYPTRAAIIALGFTITAISSYIAFMNPAVRWQNLRIAALDMESNIWQYRTRIGRYAVTVGQFDRKIEDRLGKVLQEVKDRVIDVADIKSTTFYARKASLNKHHQHEERVDSKLSWSTSGTRKISASYPETRSISERSLSVRLDQFLYNLRSAYGESMQKSPKFDDRDNHYEPLHPDRYIEFRIKPLLSFYQSRIPTKVHIRYITQSFTILGSIAISAIAIFDHNEWVPLVTVSLSAVAAYVEYSGLSGKVDRYSTTIHGLEDVLSWWKKITPIEQSSAESIELLVSTCEDIVEREQQAWKSTNQALKVMNKVTQAQAHQEDVYDSVSRQKSTQSRSSRQSD